MKKKSQKQIQVCKVSLGIKLQQLINQNGDISV